MFISIQNLLRTKETVPEFIFRMVKSDSLLPPSRWEECEVFLHRHALAHRQDHVTIDKGVILLTVSKEFKHIPYEKSKEKMFVFLKQFFPTPLQKQKHNGRTIINIPPRPQREEHPFCLS